MKAGKFCEIIVRKDMAHEQKVSCFTHEIPIYMMKYGEGNVQPVKRLSRTKELDKSDEFERLENKHGAGRDDGPSYAEALYGNKMTGALDGLIGIDMLDVFKNSNAHNLKEVKQVLSNNSDASAKEVKQTPSEPVDDIPSGQFRTKSELIDRLNEYSIEFDEGMTRKELDIFAENSLTQMIAAVSPDFEIPDSTEQNGLFHILDEQIALSNEG